jgi:hypothetical protein
MPRRVEGTPEAAAKEAARGRDRRAGAVVDLNMTRPRYRPRGPGALYLLGALVLGGSIAALSSLMAAPAAAAAATSEVQ